MSHTPFTPSSTVTTATIAASLPYALGVGASGVFQVVFTLAGTTPAICFIRFGTSSSVVAAITDFPILPNTQICLTPPSGTTHFAVVGTAGTLYATVGHGGIG